MCHSAASSSPASVVRARSWACRSIWSRNTTATAVCRPDHASQSFAGARMEIIKQLESQVRVYCRSFPTVFSTAQGNRMTARDGRVYLDFFSGAGALNYGHNDPAMENTLIDYIRRHGVNH